LLQIVVMQVNCYAAIVVALTLIFHLESYLICKPVSRLLNTTKKQRVLYAP